MVGLLSNQAANAALSKLDLNALRVERSVAKLSAGQRVVRAADDVASMALGTRIRTEVSSIGQAAVNTGQAMSLVQIVDGALSSIQDLLVRMRVLTVQSGSRNLGDAERALIDVEFQQLLLEVERIATDTQFNGQALIDRGQDFEDFGLPAPLPQTSEGEQGFVNFTVRGVDTRDIADEGDGATLLLFNIRPSGATGEPFMDIQVRFTDLGNDPELLWQVTFNDTNFPDAIRADGGGGFEFVQPLLLTLTDDSQFFTRYRFFNGGAPGGAIAADATGIGDYTIDNLEVSLLFDTTFNLNAGVNEIRARYIATTEQIDRREFDFKVGTGIVPTQDAVALILTGATQRALGIAKLGVDTAERADASNLALRDALDRLIGLRAEAGANIARLGFASQVIATNAESLENSRSRLLDLNVAEEVTRFTQRQILRQSNISALAQANGLQSRLLQLFT